jgi:hypothetical protein
VAEILSGLVKVVFSAGVMGSFIEVASSLFNLDGSVVSVVLGGVWVLESRWQQRCPS